MSAPRYRPRTRTEQHQMTTEEFAASESEAGFQKQVIELATLCGWDHYHTHDSRRSPEGWPDLALWRPGSFLLVELKAQNGRVTPAQRAMLYSLRLALPAGSVHFWRPSDWPDIERILGGVDQ